MNIWHAAAIALVGRYLIAPLYIATLRPSPRAASRSISTRRGIGRCDVLACHHCGSEIYLTGERRPEHIARRREENVCLAGLVYLGEQAFAARNRVRK